MAKQAQAVPMSPRERAVILASANRRDRELDQSRSTLRQMHNSFSDAYQENFSRNASLSDDAF